MSSKSSMEFPDDDNGAVLRRMAQDGVDLSAPRVIEFELSFPDEDSALTFAEVVRPTVLETLLIEPDEEEGTGWEVLCRQRMVPTHAAISDAETRLAVVAERHGGTAEGWGSMSKPDGSPVD